MVNVVIVSHYRDNFPSDVEVSRKITDGPLYPVNVVRSLLAREPQAINLWTRKCVSDIQKYCLDVDDLHELLDEALRSGRYAGSEWCVQNPNGPWAACDIYCLCRDEWIEYARKNMRMEYYIKFALARTGQLLLLVSCHLSDDR